MKIAPLVFATIVVSMYGCDKEKERACSQSENFSEQMHEAEKSAKWYVDPRVSCSHVYISSVSSLIWCCRVDNPAGTIKMDLICATDGENCTKDTGLCWPKQRVDKAKQP